MPAATLKSYNYLVSSRQQWPLPMHLVTWHVCGWRYKTVSWLKSSTLICLYSPQNFMELRWIMG